MKNNLNKMLKLIIFIVFVVALILSVLIYSRFNVRINQISNIIEYGDKDFDIFSTLDVSNCESVEITNGDYDVNTFGEYQLEFTATNRYNHSKVFNFNYSVKDTVEPIVELTKNEITIVEGKEFNPENYCSVDDNDDNLTISYEGDFDNTDVGTHSVIITATDSSGNVGKSNELKITVNRATKADFRTVKLGDSYEDVIKYETIELQNNGVALYERMNIPATNNYPMVTTWQFYYFFNKNNKLQTIFIKYVPNYGREKNILHIEAFLNMQEYLKKQFGNPSISNSKEDLLLNFNHYEYGTDVAVSVWEKKDKQVGLFMGMDKTFNIENKNDTFGVMVSIDKK